MNTIHHPSIWILEQELIQRELYEQTLSSRFEVKFFQNRKNILQALESEKQLPQLLIACEWIEWGGESLLISESEELDHLRNFSEKHDSDFLIYPFKKNELIVRVEKILKRSIDLNRLSKDWVFCDPLTRKVRYLGKQSSELTQREYQIFSAFELSFRASNSSVEELKLNRAELICHVWGSVKVGGKALDVHLFNLRRKIIEVGLEIEFCPPDFFRLQK